MLSDSMLFGTFHFIQGLFYTTQFVPTQKKKKLLYLSHELQNQ